VPHPVATTASAPAVSSPRRDSPAAAAPPPGVREAMETGPIARAACTGKAHDDCNSSHLSFHWQVTEGRDQLTPRRAFDLRRAIVAPQPFGPRRFTRSTAGHSAGRLSRQTPTISPTTNNSRTHAQWVTFQLLIVTEGHWRAAARKNRFMQSDAPATLSPFRDQPRYDRHIALSARLVHCAVTTRRPLMEKLMAFTGPAGSITGRTAPIRKAR
jgi:hypothetical protein